MENPIKPEEQIIPAEYYPLSEADESTSQPIGQMFKPILRRWYIVLLIFVLVSGAGIPLIWYTIKPKYRATATIEVAPILHNILYSDRESQSPMPMYDNFKNTQVEILKSDFIMIDKVLPILTQRKDLELFSHKDLVSGEKYSPTQALKKALEDGTISVASDKFSQLILVSCDSPNEEEAKFIVDTIVQEYTKYMRTDAHREEQNKKNALLAQEQKLLSDLDAKQSELNKKVESFGNTNLAGRYDMRLETAAAMKKQLTDIQVKKFALQAKLKQLEKFKDANIQFDENLLSKSTSSFLAPTIQTLTERRSEYVRTHPTVTALTQSIAQLEQELITAQLNLSKNNPELKRKQEQLAAFKKRLADKEAALKKEFDASVKEDMARAIANQINLTKVELDQTNLLEEEINKQFLAEDQGSRKIGIQQRELDKLTEEIGVTKEMLTEVRRRIRQLEIESQRPARITQHLASTMPIPDKRVKFSAGVLFGSLAFGIFLAFLSGKMDTNVRTPEDVIRCVGVPVLGTTTSSNQVDRRQLPEHIASDYQTIQANLGLLNNGNIPPILSIVSPGMGEGKTTLAINLASTLAKTGSKVLLIDGDLRKPDLARALSLPEDSWGLSDVLLGLKSFEEAVQSIPLTGLDVLTTNQRNSSVMIDQLSQPKTAECIREISRMYDHVIIDTPPILVAPDALLWARMSDAVIISSLAGQTAGPELKEAIERLQQINANIIGNVLSNVQVRNSYNRYSYGYYGKNDTKRRGGKASGRPLLLTVGADETS